MVLWLFVYSVNYWFNFHIPGPKAVIFKKYMIFGTAGKYPTKRILNLKKLKIEF